MAVEQQSERSAPRSESRLACRFCGRALSHSFADLGMTPLANAYVTPEALDGPETFFPLHAYVCETCFLVQIPPVAPPETVFGDYAYFSSYSDSWLRHAQTYVEEMRRRLALNEASQVVEIASNDGYLLQYFTAAGIPALGIEPAANVARAAQERGIETLVRFFGLETARELVAAGLSADLVIANNVLAHVPDLNGFVAGIELLLRPSGVATLEFPHVLELIEGTEFDTIYHEHLSYFSFSTVERVFAAHGLRLFNVERLPTHGGSLRIHACREDRDARPRTDAVERLRDRERAAGLDALAAYESFSERVRAAKRDLLAFLIALKRDGKSIAAYGAAAKGNTLLNYCGIGTDIVDYVVDRSPHKQGRFLPGTRIPIRQPEHVFESRPDYLLILPWNLADEIAEQMAAVREFGCRLLVPLPEPRLLA